MTSVASFLSRYNCCTARVEWCQERESVQEKEKLVKRERNVDKSQSNERIRHGNNQFAIMGK